MLVYQRVPNHGSRVVFHVFWGKGLIKGDFCAACACAELVQPMPFDHFVIAPVGST